MTEDEYRSLIQDCAIQFEFYVEQHLAKQPPDVAKAATNQDFANRCRVAIGLNPRYVIGKVQ